MGEFVKKTMMGYREALDGPYDPECTHVILTKEEYDGLLREKAQAEQECRLAKYEADKELERTRADAHCRIQAAGAEAARQIAGMEQALEGARGEIAHQRGLNETLLRISRERANAGRKLKPKKEHTGYAVISSAEKEYRYKNGDRRWCAVVLWETAIQSPYPVDLSGEQAARQIQEELFGRDCSGIIGKIGISRRFRGPYEAMIETAEWETEYSRRNVMLTSRLRANYRAGYWEVTFLHTKALDVVPADMRGAGGVHGRGGDVSAGL